MNRRIGLAALLIILVLGAYARVVNAGFIWDDDAHLTQNACVVGPAGLKEIWTTAEATYYPLVLTTFWALHKLVGLNPLPYHALNVLFHIASALLFWRVLKQLEVPGAWIGAALWALHPVMTQSVAWITEMKNTESGFFYLLCVSCFLSWDVKRKSWQLVLAVLLGALAITSKSSTVVLPAVLALCLWWRKRALTWADLLALSPFLLMSAVAAAWTIWEQKFHSGATGAEWAQTFAERAIIAGRDVWFYLAKLAWPRPLIFIYPRWSVNAADWIEYVPLVAVVLAFVVLWYFQKTARGVLLAFTYFVVALLPVLGFFNVYFFRYSFVSDHFQYLASMGPLALAGAALKQIEERWPRLKIALLALLFGGLAFLTFEQTRIYHDIETLWRSTLAQNPTAWIAHYDLARIYRDRGEFDAAIDEYRAGLAIRPTYADAHYNLAGVYRQKGDTESAILEYRTAIKLQPGDAEMHNNLGSALRDSGKTEEAVAEYETALRLQPNFAAAHANLARALLESRKTEQAIEHYRAAVDAAPNDSQIRANYAAALLRSGASENAAAEFAKVLELDRDNLVALTNLSWLLATSRQSRAADKERAVLLAEHAAELTEQSDAFALHSLAAAYAATGQFDKAVSTAERAYELALTRPSEQLAAALSRELEAYREALSVQRGR